MITVGEIEYSFSDEIVVGFSYESMRKRISLTFEAYYKNNQYIETMCTLSICSWSNGKSKLYDQDRYSELEKNLGMPSLLLSVDQCDDWIALTINTVDDRYVVLCFSGAKCSVIDA